MSNLAEYFSKYFSLSFAHSNELKQEVYKIRYKVYCEELEFEPKDKFPHGIETDGYDDRSLHFLLSYKPSQTYIGCVRAVLANKETQDSSFPFERMFNKISLNLQHGERENFFEVSRLAVIDKFRRRASDNLEREKTNSSESAQFSQEEERRQYQNIPLIPISLYLACATVGVNYNLNSFNLMEPKLARHLRRYGFPSHQIGDFVEFHGKRGAFVIYNQEVVKCFSPEVKELFTVIEYQLNPDRYQIEKRIISRKEVLI
jgi:N-acyl amino acid synthase of PEP-CTERM/exosortase system